MIQKLSSGTFFGQTESRHSIAGIVVLESGYDAEHCVPSHEHSEAFFDLILSGSCSEVVGTHARERLCSTLAFHPAGEVHSSRWHGPKPRCFHIEIPSSLLCRVQQLAPGPRSARPCRRG